MADKFASAAEAELACSVCYQFFVKPHEPKYLTKCSHILCHICIQKMTEGGLKTVTCPQCKQISPLPEEGIDGLSTILALRNLAERHPEGIIQYKEYMQNQFKNGQEKTADKMTELKELIKQTRQAIEIEEQKIEKAVELVMAKAKELIQQLKNTSGLDQLLAQLAKLKTEMTHLETSQSKLETITDEQFHTQTDAFTNQIEKFKIDEAKESTHSLSVGKFIANIIQLGQIVKQRQLKLVQEFGEFETACCIASNSRGVLAVGDWKSDPQQVSVFQKHSAEYKQRRKFSVNPSSSLRPLGIAISEDGKFLVTKGAPDFDVYTADGQFQKTESMKNKQSREEDIRTVSISKTNDDMVLVGSEVQAKSEKSKKQFVTFHDKVGSLVESISIDIVPIQITNINGTHFAVSDFFHDKVCMYDMHTGKKTLHINVQMPCGICYDEQSNCLLIGRITKKDKKGSPLVGSGVIDQYCRTSGKLVTCLVHGLYGPFGLTITEDTFLAVADVETVKLYKIE